MACNASKRCSIYATVLYWQVHELPLVERCVASLLAQPAALDLHIVVIDNGCGASPTLPGNAQVQLVHLRTNRGFTGGHNFGMRFALSQGADYVFLVNSDVIADAHCVAELVAALQQYPLTAACGPLVLSEADPRRVESAGQAFNPWTARHRELGRGMNASDIDLHIRRVDAASGCALLIRAAVARRIGLLDEDLFAYFEDMEWCLRANGSGFVILLVPRARVLHRGGGSTGRAWLQTTFYSVRNHALVAMRYGRAGKVAALPVLAYHLAFVATTPERRSAQHAQAALCGFLAAWRGRLGPEQSDARRN